MKSLCEVGVFPQMIPVMDIALLSVVLFAFDCRMNKERRETMFGLRITKFGNVYRILPVD